MKGKVYGPQKTAYQGGAFIIDIVVPPDYPVKPPVIKFDTKIWHPNIDSKDGTVTTNILSHEWNSSLTIKTALLAVHTLLELPTFDSHMNLIRNKIAAVDY